MRLGAVEVDQLGAQSFTFVPQQHFRLLVGIKDGHHLLACSSQGPRLR